MASSYSITRPARIRKMGPVERSGRLGLTSTQPSLASTDLFAAKRLSAMSTSTKRVRRPLTLAAAAGTAAHHGFELANGVGLVFQPELGLVPASALWFAQLTGWAAVAARADRWAGPLLALFDGASLAGVSVHFLLWPWRVSRSGLPLLTKAEGLAPRLLPAYNAILWGWAFASAGSLAFEVPRGSRRYALVGAASLPALAVSARHHFAWVKEQAATRPAWWNRGVTGV
jgi:hypothetical protein